MSEKGRETIVSRLREMEWRIRHSASADAALIQEAVDEILRLQGRVKVPKEPIPWDRATLKMLHNSRDTSRASAVGVEYHRLSMVKKIWLFLVNEGPHTCHEIVSEFDWLIQTVTARLNDLQKLGYIQDSGRRRPTRPGSNDEAIVWEAVEEGIDE